ncbi:MAG: hypothetical protein U5R46_17060 [Gammaproteobacteria bacterium]|nr:hypothetical protein [Gammaproteobacteria bacterium]
MSEIVQLPENFIGKEDRERLESFGGHTIGHGRATRWHWTSDDGGSDVFEIYRGGADEHLAYRVSRDRRNDVFRVHDALEREVISGDLEHIMAGLEELLSTEHGEFPA